MGRPRSEATRELPGLLLPSRCSPSTPGGSHSSVTPLTLDEEAGGRVIRRTSHASSPTAESCKDNYRLSRRQGMKSLTEKMVQNHTNRSKTQNHLKVVTKLTFVLRRVRPRHPRGLPIGTRNGDRVYLIDSRSLQLFEQVSASTSGLFRVSPRSKDAGSGRPKGPSVKRGRRDFKFLSGYPPNSPRGKVPSSPQSLP